MALSKKQIEDWKKQKYIYIDGYRSTSLKKSIASSFAALGETDDLD